LPEDKDKAGATLPAAAIQNRAENKPEYSEQASDVYQLALVQTVKKPKPEMLGSLTALKIQTYSQSAA